MKKWILLIFAAVFVAGGSFFGRFFYEKKLEEAMDQLLKAKESKVKNEESMRNLAELDQKFFAIPDIKRRGAILDEPYIQSFFESFALKEGLINSDIRIAKRADGFGAERQNFAAFVVEFDFELKSEGRLQDVLKKLDENFEGYIIINRIDFALKDSGKTAKVQLNFFVIFVGL